jgi:hypothetical protein
VPVVASFLYVLPFVSQNKLVTRGSPIIRSQYGSLCRDRISAAATGATDFPAATSAPRAGKPPKKRTKSQKTTGHPNIRHNWVNH